MDTTHQQLNNLLARFASGEIDRQTFEERIGTDDPVEYLLKYFGKTTLDHKAELLQVLRAYSDQRVLLPVMRFIFDTNAEADRVDARAVGMRLLVENTDIADTKQLYEFAFDVKEDTDPFVRALAFEILAETNPKKARPLIIDTYHNRENSAFVKERLAKLIKDFDKSVIPGLERLSTQKVISKVTEKSDLLTDEDLRRLATRDDAVELAIRWFRKDSSHLTLILQILEHLDRSKRRKLILEIFTETKSQSTRATLLQNLSEVLEGDVSNREAEYIEDALNGRDRYLRLGGIEAAIRSGSELLIRQTLDLFRAAGLPLAKTIAKKLSENTRYLPERLTAEFIDIRRFARQKRTRDNDPDWIETETSMNLVLAEVVSPDDSKVDELERETLDALARQNGLRPIIRSSLKLLLELTKENESDELWHPYYGKTLVELIDKGEGDQFERILELLARKAAAQTPGLVQMLIDKISRSDRETLSTIKPILGRMSADKARPVLQKIVEDAQETDLADRAERLLAQLNNGS